ncbi:transmembrane protein 39A-like [Clavelina lepadiformis]|uniref:transmembrane protein 39A-like n=1 Tax=Clavelina lepadiformis TaxID=159417 RepID=UPI0040415394
MPGRRNVGRQLTGKPRAQISQIQGLQNEGLTGASFNSQDHLRQSEHALNDDSLQTSTSVISNLSTMNGFAFETFFLLYAVMALFSQQLYIYRTVWWYPKTLPPSSTTVNFHLIDKNLTAFVVLLFARRLLWLLLWQYVKPLFSGATFTALWVVICFGVFGVWSLELLKNILALLVEVTWCKLMFLCYPILLWIPLNGLCLGCIGYTFSLGNNSCGKHQSFLWKRSCEKQHFGDDRSNILDFAWASNPSPEQIRERIKDLTYDVNSRLMEIIFGSMVCSYYAGLIPMFFTKPQQSYDVSWSLQHATLIFINSFVMLASYLLPSHYLHMLHKSALLLGGYHRYSKELHTTMLGDDSIDDWSPHHVFQQGNKVKFEGSVFVAVGKHNVAYPTNSSHFRFFFMFFKPLRTINWLLGLHFAVVVFQIHVLIWSSSWERLIMPALLQFFSYYILFLTLRDRIALGKAYIRLETIQQTAL